MKAAVFGLGKSGLSACQFLKKEGYEVIACDDKQNSDPDGIQFCSKDALDELLPDLDFLVLSPGVPLSHPLVISAALKKVEVFCDIELAFRKLHIAPLPISAITGSNGKTTTTMLTSHFLQAGKIANITVGNIGTPLLDEIQSGAHLICELSSFQLETTQTPVLDAACILNITPNHLDRHKTIEEYAKAKARIGLCLKESGEFWVQEKASQSFHLERSHFRFGFNPSCDLYSDGKFVHRFGKKEASLPPLLQNSRSHDVENFLAAYALARYYGVDPKTASDSYETFTKPKHRIEFVRVHNDISYYDDSKATSIDAVLRAVESLKKAEGKIVLIAGGVHKGHPYTAWKEAFQNRVRSLVLIGQAAAFIEADLAQALPIYHAKTLEEAVQKATQLSQAQDIVLLSPGCASYDMFRSFEERGLRFQEIVKKL
jgi:UDP-N-acetylmuramoylalanine--D-glutamate ligase